jgi:tetratricopeptide (TPR) repeat protein
MRSADRRVLLFALPSLLLATGCAMLLPEKASTASGAARPVEAAPEAPVNAKARQDYAQALHALRTGRMQEAEKMLHALAAREPELSGPRANLGLLYHRNGKPREAIAALKRAIDINPRRAVYHNELGILYREEGQFDNARRSYLRALELEPDYALAHRNIGILYDLYLQEPGKALEHYQRYQQLVPSESSTVSKWIIDLQQRSRSSGTKKSREPG